MPKSTTLTAVVAALAFTGGACAQTDVSVTTNAGVSFSITSQPAHWDISLSDARPDSYSFLFVGYAPGSWQINYAVPVGSVILNVLDPIGFQIGMTNANGVLKTPFAKPPYLEPWMQGLIVYCQVVCVQWTASRGSGPGQSTLTFGLSNVLPLALEKAAPIV